MLFYSLEFKRKAEGKITVTCSYLKKKILQLKAKDGHGRYFFNLLLLFGLFQSFRIYIEFIRFQIYRSFSIYSILFLLNDHSIKSFVQ